MNTDKTISTTCSSAEYDAIFEQQKKSDQKFIDTICKNVSDNYVEMAHFGKLMHENQRNVHKKQNELVRLYKAKDLLIKESGSERGILTQISLLKSSYFLLPILDVLFAWMALKPIMIAKLADYGQTFAEVIGMIMALGFGLGISLLTRLAMPAVADDMKWWKLPWITLSVLALPMIYIISEVTFNGGRSWVFTSVFATISFLIQLSIVFLYKKHIDAMQQPNINRDIKKIKKDIRKLQDQSQQIRKEFKKSLDQFSEGFKTLVNLSGRYAGEYGKSPAVLLGAGVSWFGNQLCYQVDNAPIPRQSTIKDLDYIVYMYNQIGDLSLDEYMSSLDEQKSSTYPNIAA